MSEMCVYRYSAILFIFAILLSLGNVELAVAGDDLGKCGIDLEEGDECAVGICTACDTNPEQRYFTCNKERRCTLKGTRACNCDLTDPKRSFSAPTRIEYPTYKPPVLGQGWITPASTRSDAICIDFERKEQTYQDATVDVSYAQDNNHLIAMSEASMNAKVNGLFGGFDASATIKIAKETSFMASSTQLRVNAVVDRGPIFVAPPGSDKKAIDKDLDGVFRDSWQWEDIRTKDNLIAEVMSSRIQLKDEYVTMAKDNMEQFLRECGDSFIDIIHEGGVLVGSLNFSDTTASEKHSLLADVGGGGGGASFSAGLKRQIDTFDSNNRLTMKFESHGGSGVTLPTDAGTLYKAVNDFPGKVEAGSKPIWMTVRRYDSLLNWPGGPINVLEPTGGSELVRSYLQLVYIEGVLNDVITRPAGWLFAWDVDLAGLKVMRKDVRDMENEVESMGKACVTSKNCDPGKWAKWRDFDLTLRLPIRGDFETDKRTYCHVWPAIPPGNLPQEDAWPFSMVLSNRFSRWVSDFDETRCTQLRECLEPGVLDALRLDLDHRMDQSTKPGKRYLPKQCP